MFIGRFAGQQELYQPGTARQVESGQLTFGVQGRGVQSRRDCISQPRVARNELPWVRRTTIPSTLKGLQPVRPGVRRLHKIGACVVFTDSNRYNPCRVEDWTTRTPRVARSSQPWAE